MKTDDDLILFLTRTLREIEPSIPTEKVFRVEERMRERFGGQQVWVAKHANRRTELRQKRVLAALKSGASVREIARELKVSVRTVYRIRLRLPER